MEDLTETRSKERPWHDHLCQSSSFLLSLLVGVAGTMGAVSVPSAMPSTLMNMSAAFSEKDQLSQFVPSNFSTVDSNLEVVESAMM